MTHPTHRHGPWIVMLVLALVGAFSIIPVSKSLEQRITTEQQLLMTQKSRLERQIRQWEEDASTAKKLSKTLSAADVDRLLAPTDRNIMSAQLEPYAAAARLANVTYSLAPPQPWYGADSFPGIKDMTTSDLTIDADAPDDGDVFTFLASLSALAGRIELTDLELTRLHDTTEVAPAALNLHMNARFKWFANATERME